MAPQAAVNAFRNGELDAVDVDKKDLKVQAGSRPGIDLRVSVRPVATYMVVNLDAQGLRDPRVRQAPLARIDRKTLARIRFTGLGYTEELPGSFLLLPFQPGYRDNVGSTITYDQGRARRLLDEAGWVGDGIRHRADRLDQRLVLNLPVVGEGCHEADHRPGDTVDAAPDRRRCGDQSPARRRLGSRGQPQEFDIFTLGFGWTDPFGVAYLCQFWCTNSPMNGAGAGTPALDAQIHGVQQIPEPAAQIVAANDVEAKAFRQFSDLPLFDGPTIVAAKRGLATTVPACSTSDPSKTSAGRSRTIAVASSWCRDRPLARLDSSRGHEVGGT